MTNYSLYGVKFNSLLHLLCLNFCILYLTVYLVLYIWVYCNNVLLLRKTVVYQTPEMRL